MISKQGSPVASRSPPLPPRGRASVANGNVSCLTLQKLRFFYFSAETPGSNGGAGGQKRDVFFFPLRVLYSLYGLAWLGLLVEWKLSRGVGVKVKGITLFFY